MCFVCMDVVALVLSCFIRNKKSREVKVLAVLDYMFHGGCKRISRVLSIALEHISKSAVHYLKRPIIPEEGPKDVYRQAVGIG